LVLGELALGLLARSLPPQSRGDHDACNKQWRRVRLLHEAKMLEAQHPASKSKFRFVGTLFLNQNNMLTKRTRMSKKQKNAKQHVFFEMLFNILK
jgi:hypothetical protein